MFSWTFCADDACTPTCVWIVVSANDPELFVHWQLQSSLMEPPLAWAAPSGTRGLFADMPGKRMLEPLQGAIKCLGVGMTHIISAHTHWSEQVMWFQSSARGLGTRNWCTLLVPTIHLVRLCHLGPHSSEYPSWKQSFQHFLKHFFPLGWDKTPRTRSLLFYSPSVSCVRLENKTLASVVAIKPLSYEFTGEEWKDSWAQGEPSWAARCDLIW